MPDRSAKTVAISNATVTTTAETVAAVLTIPSDSSPDQQVNLSGVVDILAGTGTTAVVARIRRGATATGALVGTGETQTLAAAATGQAGVETTDSPGLEAGQQYALTIQQTGATGNGTVNAASLEAILP